jgi:hypothetical protein
MGAEDIYRIYFHGPAYQVLERAWIDGNQMIGVMADGLPPNHAPQHLPLKMAPRVMELCFQTASLWQMSDEAVMGLPLHVDEVRVLHAPETAGALYALVNKRDGGGFDVDVVDASGVVCLQLRGYRTISVPMTADVSRLTMLRDEMPAAAMASD